MISLILRGHLKKRVRKRQTLKMRKQRFQVFLGKSKEMLNDYIIRAKNIILENFGRNRLFMELTGVPEIVELNMFIEKEGYYFIEEFEKYGINAVYTKSDGKHVWLLSLEGQAEGTQKRNRKVLLDNLTKAGSYGFPDTFRQCSGYRWFYRKVLLWKGCNVDGFITKRQDITIFTFYADCLPIFWHMTRKIKL